MITHLNCKDSDTPDNKFRLLRERMVVEQIEKRGIKNQKVLSAMRKVERHRFVPLSYQNETYEDYPLPIGKGQTISQPYIVALMSELVDPDSTKKVLEIGTGCGYQAAVLAQICDSVYTIEIIEELGKKAEQTLSELGYKNIKVKIGDGYQGWEEHAPYDAIIVTCAPTHVPQPLKDQLKENGKIIIPVGPTGVQQLVLLTKNNGKIIEKDIIPVRFVPMVDNKGTVY